MECLVQGPLLEFPPNTLEAVRKLYDLDRARIAQSVDILEQWNKKQPHFLNKNFDRHFLERSIIACKGSVEKAKSTIDKLCTLKTLLPEMFPTDMTTAIQKLKNMGCFVALPKMTNEYQRIVVIKYNLNDSDSITYAHFVEYLKLNMGVTQYIMKHDYFSGVVIIYDFRDVDVLHMLTKCNIIELQRLMTILIEGFSVRMKGFHLITASKYIGVLVNIFKTVLGAKLRERIYVHRTVEDLHNLVDKTLLPIEYGGNEISIIELREKWIAELCCSSFSQYLCEMAASRTDESRRPPDAHSHDDLPGSFRTLAID